MAADDTLTDVLWLRSEGLWAQVSHLVNSLATKTFRYCGVRSQHLQTEMFRSCYLLFAYGVIEAKSSGIGSVVR